MKTFTEWFPADVNPHRVGWYEVKCPSISVCCTGMHFWTAYDWMVDPATGVICTAYPWRGLARKQLVVEIRALKEKP